MIMQREFRGKRADNGEWIEGDLLHNYWIGGNKFLPFSIRYKINGVYSFPIEVIPETVGQFMGVKGYVGDYESRHKNEVKLFEDDIVEAWSEGVKGVFVIKMRIEGQPSWVLFPNGQQNRFWAISASDTGRDKGDFYDDLKVLGNIHDNPELIQK